MTVVVDIVGKFFVIKRDARTLRQTFTLAQQWQAGDSIWSRPAIRVFATYAKWDEKWGYDYNGDRYVNANYGIAVHADFNGGSFGRGDSDEWTFGAQMEIWW